jgi:hypothetical protein
MDQVSAIFRFLRPVLAMVTVLAMLFAMPEASPAYLVAAPVDAPSNDDDGKETEKEEVDFELAVSRVRRVQHVESQRPASIVALENPSRLQKNSTTVVHVPFPIALRAGSGVYQRN